MVHVPSLPVADDAFLDIGFLDRWLWLVTIGLTALAAEFTGRSAESKLGVANIKRTALARDLCIHSTSSSCVAVGYAARTTVFRTISAVATFTTASAVDAFLVLRAYVWVVGGGCEIKMVKA